MQKGTFNWKKNGKNVLKKSVSLVMMGGGAGPYIWGYHGNYLHSCGTSCSFLQQALVLYAKWLALTLSGSWKQNNPACVLHHPICNRIIHFLFYTIPYTVLNNPALCFTSYHTWSRIIQPMFYTIPYMKP